MNRLSLMTIMIVIYIEGSSQMLVEKGATVHLQKASLVYLESDLESFSSVTGDGMIILGGTAQYINTHGNSLPNLTVANSGAVHLRGSLLLRNALHLQGSRLILNDHDLVLEQGALIQSSGTISFIETNSTGKLNLRVNSNLSGTSVPIGYGNTFSVVKLFTYGEYNDASVGMSIAPASRLSIKENISDYLSSYWNIDRKGIHGEVKVLVQYDPLTVTGNESAMDVYYREENEWKRAALPVNFTQHSITTLVSGNNTAIYAMAPARNLRTKANVYPNPAGSYTTVMFDSDAENGVITVTDVSGRIVYTKIAAWPAGANTVTIPLTNFSKGLYTVQLQTKSGRQQFKLIKK